MGSEAGGGNVRNSTAVDSDGSDTWEDFFGTSTDLVPQLLGMFDELVRRGTSCSNHVGLPSCNIPAALQKRLSLVSRSSRRNSLLNPLYVSESFGVSHPDHHHHHHQEIEKLRPGTMESNESNEACNSTGEPLECTNVEIKIVESADPVEEIFPSRLTDKINEEKIVQDSNLNRDKIQCNENTQIQHEYSKKLNSNQNNNELSPLRYNRRCRNGTGPRPLSGSSIASSTSSSGCSNQGIASAVNPYLASVESLADTCASSRGSGDSGVVTVSDSICRSETRVTNSNQLRRDSAERAQLSYQTRPRYSDPHRNPVERVLIEIVDTEAVYVEHLRQVIEGYLIFWRDDPSALMDQPQLCDLFSNIENIYEFNSEFLKEIENCGLDPVCVANTFIKHNSGFKVYTEYCTNYPRTVAVLTDLMGHERTASAFRERQAALGHALPLGSFLLKPVQRILKYHLLLQNLLKECDAEVGENETEVGTINAIESALAAMTGIARHINVMKRKHEHAVRVQEIQSLLYGWPGPDLTTSGELVAEGRFRMRGAKAPRHAFLFDRMLLLTKKKEDGLLVYKAHIVCSNLMLIESIPGEALSFHVIPFDNPRLQYTLQARNLEQKREWTMQIKRVILENYNAVIPSHARQLVMQLGQTQPDDESMGDRGSAKKQHSAPPEYLEKRKQERERRKSETGLRQRLRKSGRKADLNPVAVEVSSAVWHFASLLQPDTPNNNLSSSNISLEDLPNSQSKNQSTESITSNSRDRSLNRSADGRTSKVKDRFASWRRKSEPGFQSYVSLNQSDEEEKNGEACTEETIVNTELYEAVDDLDVDVTVGVDALDNTSSSPPTPVSAPSTPLSTKDNNNDKQKEQVQTMEEIVGHILMQNRDFQKLLEKQRTSSIINMRQQQRFNKHIASADTSDDSETENDTTNNNIRGTRSRLNRREQRLVRANNARNSTSPPPRDEKLQPMLQLRYDNLRVDHTDNSKPPTEIPPLVRNRTNRVNEKRAIFEAFKRQSITTESKVIQTALRIRENSAMDNENEKAEDAIKSPLNESSSNYEGETKIFQTQDQADPKNIESNDESKGFGNYDNLQRVWEGVRAREQEIDGGDSPTRPAVWLTKLCEDLPTTTQKSGSLPRSFQINPQYPEVTKSRFLQRDGKPMSERPFTIASDKPAEINLEDMERYTSSCQPEARIAKFPMSTSTSTFFYSLEDAFADSYSEIRSANSTSTNVHPDHKIYRANNGSAGTILKNVFAKAGSRLQGLRSTESIETLECSDEADRNKLSRSIKSKKKSKSKSSRESSSDVDEIVSGCVAGGTNTLPSRVPRTIPSVYYKQGSSGLGARIAQSDYADPTVLFGESITMKRAESVGDDLDEKSGEISSGERIGEEKFAEEGSRESEADSFYEKSFETIENYVDHEADEVFRDSAIFSDMDDVISAKNLPPSLSSNFSSVMNTTRKVIPAIPKVPPPVPAKRKPDVLTTQKLFNGGEIVGDKLRPSVAQKPSYLKVNSLFKHELENTITKSLRKIPGKIHQSNVELTRNNNCEEKSVPNSNEARDDVSAGQSRAGWVRKMVGQLQGQDEA